MLIHSDEMGLQSVPTFLNTSQWKPPEPDVYSSLRHLLSVFFYFLYTGLFGDCSWEHATGAPRQRMPCLWRHGTLIDRVPPRILTFDSVYVAFTLHDAWKHNKLATFGTSVGSSFRKGWLDSFLFKPSLTCL